MRISEHMNTAATAINFLLIDINITTALVLKNPRYHTYRFLFITQSWKN